jgi:hypothetical protein
VVIVLNLISKFKNRKKHKLVFRLQSNNKKFCTVKFTDKEFLQIKLAAKYQHITVEEFILHTIKSIPKR